MAYQETKTRLVNALSSRGIEIPPKPTGQMGQYLLRGESDLSKWSGEATFQPKSGQWGTWGVFLGDNLSSLMYPDVGIFWVFNPDRLTSNWLDSRSPEFAQLVQDHAQKIGKNPASIAGYYECERKIYETGSIYDSLTGIATVERSIPTSLAVTAILMLADKVEIK